MLNRNDYRSIWEIAHLWEDFEPPDNDPLTLSEGVIDKIQKLIRAYRTEQIILRHPNERKTSVLSDAMLYICIIDRTPFQLRKCLNQNHFPRSLLNRLFVLRSELLDFCDKDRTEPPTFWASSTSSISKDSQEIVKEILGSSHIGLEQKTFIGTLINSGVFRPRNAKLDSMICQALARTLWDEYPDMTIEDMKKHKAIQIYGNGRAYSGKNTLRDWLSMVDPRDPDTKSGRRKTNSAS